MELISRQTIMTTIRQYFLSQRWSSVLSSLTLIALLLTTGSLLKAEETNPASTSSAKISRINQIERILSGGGDINVRDEHGRTPLIWASANVETEVVRLLVAKGADVAVRDNIGQTPLIAASSRKGSFEILKMLIENGADVNVQDQDKENALIAASTMGETRSVKFLLDHGASINSTDNSGRTALMHACFLGHFQIVKLLLDYGANADIKDKDDSTAMTLASVKYREDIAALLEAHSRRK